jgi:ADP-ribosylglycohydrolase
MALKGSPRSRVKRLMSEGLMPMQWPPRLDEEPDPPFPEDLADKVAGMLLGLAIGDALGNSSESLLPSERHRRYGWITDYLPNRHAGNAMIGLPSDDTQLAFWTLEHLIECGELDPARLAKKFSERRIFGLGQSMRQFLRDYKAGADWTQAGAPSAGNGALMRIAPVLVPHLFDPSIELWTDTLLAAHVTHRDALSNVACLAFVDLLWHWIGKDELPVSEEWLERFATFCADIEPDTHYEPRGGHPPGFSGTLSQMIRTYVMPALEQQLPVVEACAIWHSGAYLLETVPSVLYILARHGHDPEAAILSAVNETKDNDTIAAIVGAAMGALHGRSKLPPRWLENLSGRTGTDDDGRVVELIEIALKKF